MVAFPPAGATASSEDAQRDSDPTLHSAQGLRLREEMWQSRTGLRQDPCPLIEQVRLHLMAVEMQIHNTNATQIPESPGQCELQVTPQIISS